MHKKKFIKFWERIRNIFCWMFREHELVFGEIELLNGRHDLALPIDEDVCHNVKHVKEVWVSLDERCSCVPVCSGDDSQNWVYVRICGEEIRVTVDVRTDKVLLKWMILI